MNDSAARVPAESPLFALLHAAQRLEARIEARLGEVGLSLARLGVLDQLVRAGEPLALGELAARLSCVRSNITQLVDRLESEGLVRRVADADDRRSVRAELTPAGRERQAAGQERLRAVQQELEATLPVPVRAALGELVETLV